MNEFFERVWQVIKDSPAKLWDYLKDNYKEGAGIYAMVIGWVGGIVAVTANIGFIPILLIAFTCTMGARYVVKLCS